MPPTLRRAKSATVVSVYASIRTNSDEAKTKFYKDLHTLLASVPKADKQVVLDDFNAHIVTDCAVWEEC
nr:unnamed protein product [Spirometra erinaceieuropaei]